jgi:hypothetical protein
VCAKNRQKSVQSASLSEKSSKIIKHHHKSSSIIKNHQASSKISHQKLLISGSIPLRFTGTAIRGGKSGETARPLVALGSGSGHVSENPDLNGTRGTLTGKDEMAKHGILTLHNLKFFWSSGKRIIFFGRWGLKIS